VLVGIDVSSVAVGTGVSVVPCALFVAASWALLVAVTCAPLSLVLVVVVVVLPEFAIALAPTHAKMAMISRIAHIGKHPALRRKKFGWRDGCCGGIGYCGGMPGC
jgi:hypothetical protein